MKHYCRVAQALTMSLLPLFGVLLAVLCCASSARATTFPVTIPSGDVSGLIAAINDANSNGAGTDDVIKLSAGTYTLTAVDKGQTGLPSIVDASTNGKLAINGNMAMVLRLRSAVRAARPISASSVLPPAHTWP